MKIVRHLVSVSEKALFNDLKKAGLVTSITNDKGEIKDIIVFRGKNHSIVYPILITVTNAVFEQGEIVTPAVMADGVHCDIMFFDGLNETGVAEELVNKFDELNFNTTKKLNPKSPRHSWA